MEAHHPHHPSHKKTFGEYILEFLMLFFAVFLGFVAENLRENGADHRKEKEYMASIVEDLQKDTSAFTFAIQVNQLLVDGQDTAINFLLGDLQKKDTAELALIYFLRYCIHNYSAPLTDRTISQLKNNGGMRLIRNRVVSNAIISYYNSEQQLNDQASPIIAVVTSNDKDGNAIFNFKTNRSLIDSFMIALSFSTLTPLETAKNLLSHRDPVLFTTDPKTISTFASNIEYARGLMAGYAMLLDRQKNQADSVIQLIKEQYKLKKD